MEFRGLKKQREGHGLLELLLESLALLELGLEEQEQDVEDLLRQAGVELELELGNEAFKKVLDENLVAFHHLLQALLEAQDEFSLHLEVRSKLLQVWHVLLLDHHLHERMGDGHQREELN